MLNRQQWLRFTHRADMTLSFPIAETRKAFKSGESFPTAELGLRRDVIN